MTPRWSPNQLPDLTSKVFIVTGGNSGIGYITVRDLLTKNAKVWLGARDASKAETAIRKLRQDVSSGQVQHLLLDHMDLKSVARAAEVILKNETSLNGLINNAGIMATPFALSMDGYSDQFQTNYLSHWLLTYKLLPLLQSTAIAQGPGSARVVCVSSGGHRFYTNNSINFDDVNSTASTPYGRYGLSKLGNIMQAKEIAARYGADVGGNAVEHGQVWAASCHPGNYDTNLTQGGGRLVVVAKPILKFLGIIDRDMNHGSYSSLYIAASKEFDGAQSGGYFVPLAKQTKPSSLAQNSVESSKLWNWTEQELRRMELI